MWSSSICAPRKSIAQSRQSVVAYGVVHRIWKNICNDFALNHNRTSIQWLSRESGPTDPNSISNSHKRTSFKETTDVNRERCFGEVKCGPSISSTAITWYEQFMTPPRKITVLYWLDNKKFVSYNAPQKRKITFIILTRSCGTRCNQAFEHYHSEGENH